MPTCPDAPLAASVDIDACESPPSTRAYGRCCRSMAIPFNPSCDGCTGLELAHHAISLWAAAYLLLVQARYVAGACCLVYIPLQCVSAMSYKVHFAQAIVAVAVAVDSAHCCSTIAWLAMLAVVAQLGAATISYEYHRCADCRRCMCEWYRCECGKFKDPVPQGSLAHLADLIEAQWVPLKQR